MNRLAFGSALVAALAACDLSSPPIGVPFLKISPILDSTFVGDTLPPRSVTFYDAEGNPQPSGVVRWSSSDTLIARVDSVTGRIVGRGRGAAVITATANGVSGPALVVVSRQLDLTLLLDTLYLMPRDTITLPVAVKKKGGSPPAPWFNAPANAVFTVDSASGLVTANSPGGPIRYVAHADTVADTGAVTVLSLTDTLGGRAFFTVLGTAIRHQSSTARGLNYARTGDTLTFRLQASVTAGTSTIESLVITLRDSLTGTGTFVIDSLSPLEATARLGRDDASCKPPRPWGLWSSRAVLPSVTALSRFGGAIVVTQNVAVSNGRAVSGRFAFTAQRLDLYGDPLGLLAIRGVFVAPLTTNREPCEL